MRAFLILTALIASSVVQAADMSNWSDKTVCRLVESQKDNAAYVAEAKVRSLSCAADSQSDAGTISDNPLDSLTIPDDWQLISNWKVFNDERKAHIRNKEHYDRVFDSECYFILKNWQKNVVEYARKDHRKFQYCAQKLNIYGYLGFHPDSDEAPPEIHELYLHWAKTNGLKIQTTKLDPLFSFYSYNTGMSLGSYAGYYAIFYDYFNYTETERNAVNNMFTTLLKKVEPIDFLESGQKMCNGNSLSATANGLRTGKTSSNTCGSILLAIMHGQLLLGLKLNDEELFKKGIETVKWILKFIDEKGVYLPYAIKGGHAISYTNTMPHYLGALTEIFATIGYDFLEHRLESGVTVKEVFDSLVDVFNDHLILVKYNNLNDLHLRYGGDGWTLAEYKTWSSPQALIYASYSWEMFARQSARYVDKYRPDLQKYRKPDYKSVGENGQGMDTITGHLALDPYMLYEANYLSNTGAELSAKPQKKGSASFKYVPKTVKSEYVSASKRVEPISPTTHLENLAKELTKTSAVKAQSGIGFDPVKIKRQNYLIDWYLINTGPSVGEPELMGTDELVLHGKRRIIPGEQHFFPSANYREKMKVQFNTSNQTITIRGEINTGYNGSIRKISIRGSLKSGFAFGKNKETDIYVISIREP